MRVVRAYWQLELTQPLSTAVATNPGPTQEVLAQALLLPLLLQTSAPSQDACRHPLGS